MQILNEAEFKKLVQKLLNEKAVEFRDIESSDRKKPILSQDTFFDLDRSHVSHVPDLLFHGQKEPGPCELKSPKEIYNVCRYSRAHLVSYLCQTIYGQCMSYADLFRTDDATPLKIYLIISRTIVIGSTCFGSIENTFSSLLAEPQELIKKEMRLSEVRFSPPCFSQFSNNAKYGTLGTDNESILATKIEYKVQGTG